MNPTRALSLNAPLATERLTLEPLLGSHAAELFAPLQDEAVYRWISSVPPESVQKLQARWTRSECRLSPEGDDAWLAWAVRRTADGALVGKVDAVVNAESVATNVGYIFFPAYTGQGYATEAVVAVAAHLARSGVHELRATVTVGNVASTRVLEKAGFVQTRVLPDNDTIRGVKFDDLEYVRATAAAARSPERPTGPA